MTQLSTAERTLIAATPPGVTHSIRGRVLGRSRDQAAPERPLLVLHDVTMRYPNGKLALRDVDGTQRPGKCADFRLVTKHGKDAAREPR